MIRHVAPINRDDVRAVKEYIAIVEAMFRLVLLLLPKDDIIVLKWIMLSFSLVIYMEHIVEKEVKSEAKRV